MKLRPEWSQRLLRKGVLVQETYELFAKWDYGLSAAQNLKSALSERFRTAGWQREVNVTRFIGVSVILTAFVRSSHSSRLSDLSHVYSRP